MKTSEHFVEMLQEHIWSICDILVSFARRVSLYERTNTLEIIEQLALAEMQADLGGNLLPMERDHL